MKNLTKILKIRDIAEIPSLEEPPVEINRDKTPNDCRAETICRTLSEETRDSFTKRYTNKAEMKTQASEKIAVVKTGLGQRLQPLTFRNESPMHLPHRAPKYPKPHPVNSSNSVFKQDVLGIHSCTTFTSQEERQNPDSTFGMLEFVGHETPRIVTQGLHSV
jgi:hypothetical protein